jgi:hypothetical protein
MASPVGIYGIAFKYCGGQLVFFFDFIQVIDASQGKFA